MKNTIYIGEKFSEVITARTKIVIGSSTAKIYEYENTSDVSVQVQIDTSDWQTGEYALVTNTDGTITLDTVRIIDPLASTDQLQDALNQIQEIDKIIEDRAKNAVSQITINNKTIVNMPLETLTALRAMYVKRANKLRGNTGVFKSVTVFRGK